MSEVFDINFSERHATTGELIWHEDDMEDYNEQENDAVAAEAEQAEYHRRLRTVICDAIDCTAQARGTQKALEDGGWSLGPGWELCGRHD